MLEQALTLLVFGFPVPPEMIDPNYPIFLQQAGGLLLTLLITLFSLIIGAGVGTTLAVARRNRTTGQRDALRSVVARTNQLLVAAFVEGIRALPIMLLVLLIFYVPYRVVEIRVPSFALAIAAFSLYAGVYFSEILRAGFRSVDPGLRQAGRVLGLTPWQILWKIELPIACRTMMPDVINLAVTVFKDTSTLAIVAVPELTYVVRQLLMAKPMEYEVALLMVLVLYWMPAMALSMLAFRVDPRRARLGGDLDTLARPYPS
jgi:His/Glu/Gln/Arg/opine family amino acid ABC transporter permease subunit